MSLPRIGLNCDVSVDDAGATAVRLGGRYVEAVVRGGGLPVILPPVPAGLVGQALAGVDGLVLVGGRDYDPALYGRPAHPATRLLSGPRMAFDVALARAALAARVPTLGICGGAQLLNVALGAPLVQDIASELPQALRHTREGHDETFHPVEVADGTRLAAIVGAGELEVNSSHHQAIDRPAEGLRVAARAPDGVVEAAEGTGQAFLLAVQWHPERLLERAEHAALFGALVEAAGGRQ